MTSDPTQIAGANLDAWVRAADPTFSLVPLAGAISSSALVGSELRLTVSDPTKQGISNILRANRQAATMLEGAIATNVSFAFKTIRYVDG